MNYEKPIMKIDVVNMEDIVKCSNISVGPDPNKDDLFTPIV